MMFAGLRGVPRAQLPREVIAGVTLAALAIPLNIGYAQIAGLPPVVGLYTAIVPMLVFALFASSRQLVASPDAPIAALIASLLGAMAAAGSTNYVQLAYAQALVCALVFLLFYVFKLGFLANFLSEPVLVGFIAGLAIEILTSQVEKILGIKTTSEHFFPELWEIVTKIPQAHWWNVAVGVGTMALILVLRRVAPALPGPLIALIAATVLVAAAGLDRHGVSVLGAVPSGLPVPHFPSGVSLGQWATLIPGAIAICAVTLADGLLTARRYAEQHNYTIDGNQELMAFGVSNIAAGLTGSMTIGSSASRTAAMDSVGSRSQIPSVVCALVVAVLLAFFSDLLAYLPNAALAGIVAVAVIRLIDVRKLTELWHLRRSEFWIATVCMLGVPVLGSLSAVVIAFLLSAVDMVRRASSPSTAVLEPGPAGRYVRARQPGPGPAVYRFEGPLFFANAAAFKEQVLGLTATDIVLDAEAISDVDTTGAEALRQVIGKLQAQHRTLVVARATRELRDLLTHYGLRLTHFDSNEAAVAAQQP
ncbi:SulP family inorganic anion transporter [Nonomuraea sp. NPDC050328]|uniref:SulP family inorganic anion transporter n=1 Tax=Nonomuraea sp. NPDC050328 TaxID=3364361 RepID=UPI003795413A